MGQLQKINDSLIELGYQVLFLSSDRPEKLRHTLEKGDYDYVLLSDAKADAARAFGVVFKVDDAMLKRFAGFGIDLKDASGESHHLLPVPSVFVLDDKGVVRFSYVDPDYSTRIDPDLLLAAATSIAK